MAKHVIFAIHGIGDHDAHWCDSVAATLKSLYGQYGVAKLPPFDDQFEVIPLYYDDKFDALWKIWENARENLERLRRAPSPAPVLRFRRSTPAV